MPAVRKPSIQPNRWQLSGWALGSVEFKRQVHQVLRAGFEKMARRSSAWRESNGEVAASVSLQPAEFLLLEGVGIEISRQPTEGMWGGKQLRALEESLRAMPGWEPGFAVVLGAWVGFPLYANSMEASPKAYIFTPDLENPSDFRISDLNFGDALHERIRQVATDDLKTHEDTVRGPAEDIVHAVLKAQVHDYALRSPVWALARERSLSASLPTMPERVARKPRF